MNIMKRKFSILQMIFIPLMLFFFICMNMGFVKYNDNILVGSILLFTLGTLLCIWKFKDDINKPLSQKTYFISLWGVFIVSFIIQTLVCLYVPLAYYSDFIKVRDQAIYMASDYSIIPQYDFYFHSYPYQLSIVVIINFLYELLGSYKGVEIVTTLLVNISAILAGLTTCNITGNRRVSILVAIMFEVFSTFCLKTYMPYSANLGMIFPILIFFIYTTRMNRIWKVVCIALAVAIGYRVKMTTIIPFIAMVMFGGYKLLKEHDFKTVIIGFVSLLTFSYTLSSIHSCMLEKMHFVNDEKINHGFIYYVAMGQNNHTGGQYNHDLSVLADRPFPSKEVRDKYFLNMALQSVNERSVIGQLKFFVAKIAFCWGETYIDHLYFCKWDKFFLIIKHYTWYLAMTLMVIGTFFIRDRRYYMQLLGIWGVIAYLYLSEAGARYVLMYMPLVYVMAGWSVSGYRKKNSFGNLPTT